MPVTVRATGSSCYGFGLDVAAEPSDPGSSAGKALDPDTEPDDEVRQDSELGPRVIGDAGIVDAFAAVQRTRPELARVLIAYRGVQGNRWGHMQAWGRLFAVWPETPSGRQLMADASERQRRELGARPLVLLAMLRQDEELAKISNMRRRALLTRADREARQLVDLARRVLAERVRG